MGLTFTVDGIPDDLDRAVLLAKAGNVSALRDWVGKVGFNEAVAELAKKIDRKTGQPFGPERAKKIVGKLKGMANRAGTLAPEHAYDPKERAMAKARRTGEGSRGGRVIGHTKSGKAIYDSALGGHTTGWSVQDHSDAAKLHATRGNLSASTYHRNRASEAAGVVDRAHDAQMRDKGWERRRPGDMQPGDTFRHYGPGGLVEKRVHKVEKHPLDTMVNLHHDKGMDRVHHQADLEAKVREPAAAPKEEAAEKWTMSYGSTPVGKFTVPHPAAKTTADAAIGAAYGGKGETPGSKYTREQELDAARADRRQTGLPGVQQPYRKPEQQSLFKGIVSRVLAALPSFLKAGGEGSRGGRVIGHTRSGKPIYQGHDPGAQKDYTHKDHADAAEHHNYHAEHHRAQAEGLTARAQGEQSKEHAKLSYHHETQATLHRQDAQAKMTMAERIAAADERKKQGDWHPASGGKETPFRAASGATLTYMHQPSSGEHAYYHHGEDRILSHEEAEAHMKHHGDPAQESRLKHREQVDAVMKRRGLREKKGLKAHVPGPLEECETCAEMLKGAQMNLGFGSGVARGEGSRGGKVIGHTKSGKPIYFQGTPSTGCRDIHRDQHAGFSPAEHREAAAVHRGVRDQHDKTLRDMSSEALEHRGSRLGKPYFKRAKDLEVEVRKMGAKKLRAYREAKEASRAHDLHSYMHEDRARWDERAKAAGAQGTQGHGIAGSGVREIRASSLQPWVQKLEKRKIEEMHARLREEDAAKERARVISSSNDMKAGA